MRFGVGVGVGGFVGFLGLGSRDIRLGWVILT